MQTATATATANPSRKAGDRLGQLKSDIAQAILSGATQKTLKKLDESWHEDVRVAVEAIDHFYNSALERRSRLCANHVLFLNYETAEVWVEWMGRNERYSGEDIGEHIRMAERDGELPMLWINREQVTLPPSAGEFRGYFASKIAEVLVDTYTG